MSGTLVDCEMPVAGTPVKCKMPVFGTPVKCKMPVSGTLVKCEMAVSGIPGNCNTFTVAKIAGVWDTGEMQNVFVPDTGKSFFLLFTGFFKLQTIPTGFKATMYQKIVQIYYLLYKYI